MLEPTLGKYISKQLSPESIKGIGGSRRGKDPRRGGRRKGFGYKLKFSFNFLPFLRSLENLLF